MWAVPPPPPAGLCASCTHLRVVRSGRGSVFVMCERGLRREPGFAKYPGLPVLQCSGLEVTVRTSAPDGSEH
ncbi:MAG: hypothetical protein JHD16_10505 [Solirubrobacteraceae bacterium]|nr:hypothetical protein [Solirubrobacteraceae bacterium]